MRAAQDGGAMSTPVLGERGNMVKPTHLVEVVIQDLGDGTHFEAENRGLPYVGCVLGPTMTTETTDVLLRAGVHETGTLHQLVHLVKLGMN